MTRQKLTVADGHATKIDGGHNVHVFDVDTIDAVNAALAARRPLLVRGEPGTGKTQLARAVAAELGRAFFSLTVDSRTEPTDLRYRFDAVARLGLAQILGAVGGKDRASVEAELAESRFLSPGPLWWAFDYASAKEIAQQAGSTVPAVPASWTGTVALIDEIDKADPDVPNGLLEALGERRFTPPGTAPVIMQGEPLVVVTTNEERSLPDAFVRRCLVLKLRLADDPTELKKFLIARGKAHFPDAGPAVLEQTAELLIADRAHLLGKVPVPPGQAEFLDLLGAVVTLEPNEPEKQRELVDRLAKFTYRKHPESDR